MRRIGLGTVQFGLNYGINNASGQVNFQEANKILEFSKLNHINTLDTAFDYGDSETMLGKIGVEDYNVITKTASLKYGVNNVLAAFNQSLKNLNTDKIYGLLIHDINDIEENNFDALYTELLKLKQNNVINKIGFSTYLPEQVDLLLNHFDFDIIQVPINVFDNRLIQNGQINNLENNKIEIHARSIFLQGLLLNFNKIDRYFSKWSSEFNSYEEIVRDSNLSLLEYALNFVLNIKEIDKVIVGVDKELQLKEINDSIIENQKISPFPIDDPSLLNPGIWKI